ncbi:MAG: glycosyltransferase family 2 protein [Clostridia bacterium]|nr:glycosyltransferase family 2 protein [Clostridia bacterium]
MIDIDIAVVTYNSEKWIDGFLTSFENSQGVDLSKLHFYFTDNCSTDNTVEALKNHPASNSFGAFEVISRKKNLGFGAGSNRAASAGKSSFIFFVNIDTEIENDTLKILVSTIEKSKGSVGAWEMRQLPYEHPKIYNPATLETSWISGACFVLRRDIFEKTGGFDEDIFMYGEDVELSWRIRNLGYKLLYLPDCCINHYSYAKANEVKPLQYFGSLKANILLRWRYGNFKDILTGYINLARYVVKPHPLPGARIQVLKIILNSLAIGLKFKNKYKSLNKSVASFYDFEYEYARFGAFYKNERYDKNCSPLVSIIVRTCGRPLVLKECLDSIKNQTYKNIEVCIAEDGENISENFIRKNFSDLRIKYTSTGAKKGRSYAGNLALSMAEGEYFNFLDDDDMFYCDHIETMINEALKHPSEKLFYAKCFETPVEIRSKTPYIYDVKDYVNVKRPSYTKANLTINNLFPIQSVFFKREVYESLGGFNTKYEYLEDWDLWLRYSTFADYIAVDKTTSVYRVPADKSISKDRSSLLKINEAEIRNKYMQKSVLQTKTFLDVCENSDFLYTIDSVNLYTDDTLLLTGWGFFSGQESDIYIRLTDTSNKEYLFNTQNSPRPDVLSLYPSAPTNCGVFAWINLNPEIIKKIITIELICCVKNQYYSNTKKIYNYQTKQKYDRLLLTLRKIKRHILK